MTHTLVHTYSTIHAHRRHITLALLAACMVMAMIYVVDLYRVVSHSVALQHIGTQTASIDAAINKLDAEYITLSRSISPDMVKAQGLGQAPVSAFISRTASLGRSSALSGHEL